MSANASNINGTRKLYRVVRDQVRTIQPSVFKSQLEDTSDIVVTQVKLAPRTKRGMVHHFYDHLENYFVSPGRKIPSRPLQKIFDRNLNSLREAAKTSAAAVAPVPGPLMIKAELVEVEGEGGKVWMDGMELEPLNHDLRTPATKNVPNMEADASVAGLFPSRNRSDIRRSYVRKKPKAPVLLPTTSSLGPIISFSTSTAAVSNTQSTNSSHPTPSAATYTITLPPGGKQDPSHSLPVPIIINTASTTVPGKGDTSSANPSNSKVVGYATRSRSRSGSQSPSKHQNQKEVLITPDIPSNTEFVVGQFAIGSEVSLDDSGVISSSSVNSNVLDLSDLIQTPVTSSHSQAEPKIDGNSGEIVFCTELEDMSEVVVMDQNGERYRFVALNDGQLSLVAADSVQ